MSQDINQQWNIMIFTRDQTKVFHLIQNKVLIKNVITQECDYLLKIVSSGCMNNYKILTYLTQSLQGKIKGKREQWKRRDVTRRRSRGLWRSPSEKTSSPQGGGRGGSPTAPPTVSHVVPHLFTNATPLYPTSPPILSIYQIDLHQFYLFFPTLIHKIHNTMGYVLYKSFYIIYYVFMWNRFMSMEFFRDNEYIINLSSFARFRTHIMHFSSFARLRIVILLYHHFTN